MPAKHVEKNEALLNSIENENNVIVYGRVAWREYKSDVVVYELQNAYVLISGKRIDLNKVNVSSDNTTDIIPVESLVAARGILKDYDNASNPGGYNSALYYLADECYYRMFAKKIETASLPDNVCLTEILLKIRERAASIIYKGCGSEYGAFLSAMLLGDKHELTYEQKSNYSVTGLSHLLAISGLHIGLIGMLLEKLFKKLFRKRMLSAAAASSVLFLYCVMSGCGESTIRAYIMYTIMLASEIFLRSYDTLSSLSLAGIILLSIDPYYLFRAGFQFSFLAVFGIYVLLDPIEYFINAKIFGKITNIDHGSAIRKKIINVLISGTSLWLSVNIMTMPLVMWYYCEIPVLSILTNIIFVPAMAPLMVLSLLGVISGIFSTEISEILFLIPKLLISMQNLSGEMFKDLSFTSYITGRPEVWKLILWYISVLIISRKLNLWHKKHKEYALIEKNTDHAPDEILNENRGSHKTDPFRLLSKLLLTASFAVCFVKFPKGFSLTALDVGQGDCLVVKNNYRTFIVDCGSSSSESIGKYTLVPYLKSQGISFVDAVFLSHPDLDHMNGLEEFFEMISVGSVNIHVDKLIMPEWTKEDYDAMELAEIAEDAGAAVIYTKCGDSISGNDFSIKVLGPEENAGLEGNAGSLVLGVYYKNFSALLTGDLEGEGESAVAARARHFDVLKVAHHGSKNSTSEEFLNVITPTLGLISAPENSLYGHPHAELLSRLEKAGCSYYQTGLCGALKVTVKNDRYILEKYKKDG